MTFKSYLKGIITLDSSEYVPGRIVRNFWKGILDFIRNLIGLSFLQYVAVKTHSPIIKILFEFGTIALAGYFLAFGALSFNFFSPVRNPIIRERLNSLTYYLASFVIYLLLRNGIKFLVAEIAQAQLMH
jgi:hypothetical protein